MTNANDRVSHDNYCLAETNDKMIVVYLKEGGSATIDLSNNSGRTRTSSYLVNWYDPRSGGALKFGSVKFLATGDFESLGEAPNNQDKDWVILLTECPDCQVSSGEGGGTDASLIAGLVVAGVVLGAIALYFGVRHANKSPTINSKKTSSETESVPGEAPPEDIHLARDPPESGSSFDSRSGPSIHGKRAFATALRETSVDSAPPGPAFKDQVRNLSVVEGNFIPTVAAVEVSNIEEGAETPLVLRIEC